MNEEILNYIYKEIGKSKIVELKGDASSRKYFRIIKNNNSYIVSDSSMENKQFSNTILVNQILKKAQLSIPEIYHYDKQSLYSIFFRLRSRDSCCCRSSNCGLFGDW